MSDLTVKSPLEIDTQIAALQGRLYDLFPAQQSNHDSVLYAAGAKRTYGRRSGWTMTFEEALRVLRNLVQDEALPSYDLTSAQRTLARHDSLRDQATAINEEIRGLNAEWIRRGRWTRAFLVTDGHVHKSQDCSTCNNGEYDTQFTWLVDFADKDEAEVIEAAAERACTVCYPNAPVETAGPSTLMTPDERSREQKRQEAEQARQDRLAKKIEKGLTEDGSEFEVSYPTTLVRYRPNPDDSRTKIREEYIGPRTERFKTEQAAVSWLVQYTLWDAGRTTEKAPAFQAIREAVADKHGMTMAEVDAMITKKIAAKKKRDGYV